MNDELTPRREQRGREDDGLFLELYERATPAERATVGRAVRLLHEQTVERDALLGALGRVQEHIRAVEDRIEKLQRQEWQLRGRRSRLQKDLTALTDLHTQARLRAGLP